MVFPVIVLCLYKRKWLTVICCVVFVIAAYLSIMFLLPRTVPFNPTVPMPHNLDSTYDYGFLRGLAGFTTSLLLYILYQAYSIKNIFQKDIVSFISFISVIAAMHFDINDGLYIPLYALLILALACNYGFVTKMCDNRILQYFGNISYSIYMAQIIILFFVPPIVGALGITIPQNADKTFVFSSGLLYCLVILSISVAFSSLTYYTIKVPCRKWINKKWAHRKYIVYDTDERLSKAS